MSLAIVGNVTDDDGCDKKEQAKLYQQGIKSEVLREEPFVTAQDELDYKVYLMIYKWQGKNRGVNVRRIN